MRNGRIGYWYTNSRFARGRSSPERPTISVIFEFFRELGTDNCRERAMSIRKGEAVGLVLRV
jgi:hypothetical protein